MTSPRSLLRAMTITGGTQAVGVVLSIARMKALALLLGPSGVGVLSLYNGLQSTATTLAGLGVDNSAVRQIAQAKDEGAELSRVRRVLLAANLVQGGLAMAAIWLLRAPIARWLFGQPGYAFEVGLVGVAVFLALLGASQTALLRGMRRIGDLGRITVLGALAGTLGGIAAVWALGADGLLWFVLMQPLTAVLVAAYYVRRLPGAGSHRLGGADIWRIWKPMVRLGAGFMIAGLATTGALLLVRGRIAAGLGLDAAGQFAAAWGIAVTYVGFLLNAMGMDYYPRLAEVVHDRPAANRLMNEQMQLALAIGGPVLLLLIGLAPLAIAILYSSRFGEAVALLQWQTAGNVFKLASWTLGFSVIAAARTRALLLLEACFLVPYAGLIWLLLPVLGLDVAGIAFLSAYVLHLGAAWFMAVRITGFAFEPLSRRLILAHGASALGLLALSLAVPLAGAIASVVFAAATGIVGLHIVLEKIGAHRYTAPLVRAYAACGWPLSEQT